MDKTSIKKNICENKNYRLLGLIILVFAICIIEFCNDISTVAAKSLYLFVFITFAVVFYLNYFVENLILCLTFEVTFVFLGYIIKEYLEYILKFADLSQEMYIFILNTVMILVMYLIVEYILSNILDYKNYIFTNLEFVVLFIFCFTGFLMVTFATNTVKYYISALCVVAMLVGAALIKIFRQKEEKENLLVEKNRFLEKQSKLIKDREEAKYKIYQKSADIDAKVRQQNHDLIHHFDHLLTFEGLTEDAIAYINKIKMFIKDSRSSFNTGSSILDLILEEKSKLADKENVQLKVIGDFSDELFLEPTSLSIIFENLINNAIDATQKLSDDEYKIVNVVFYQEPGKEFYIKISNTAVTDNLIINKDGLLEVVDKAQHFHGISLGSVKAEVKKYGGNMRISIEKNFVTVEVFVPV